MPDPTAARGLRRAARKCLRGAEARSQPALAAAHAHKPDNRTATAGRARLPAELPENSAPVATPLEVVARPGLAARPIVPRVPAVRPRPAGLLRGQLALMPAGLRVLPPDAGPVRRPVVSAPAGLLARRPVGSNPVEQPALPVPVELPVRRRVLLVPAERPVRRPCARYIARSIRPVLIPLQPALFRPAAAPRRRGRPPCGGRCGKDQPATAGSRIAQHAIARLEKPVVERPAAESAAAAQVRLETDANPRSVAGPDRVVPDWVVLAPATPDSPPPARPQAPAAREASPVPAFVPAMRKNPGILRHADWPRNKGSRRLQASRSGRTAVYDQSSFTPVPSAAFLNPAQLNPQTRIESKRVSNPRKATTDLQKSEDILNRNRSRSVLTEQ